MQLLLFIQSHFRNDIMDKIMIFLSKIGDNGYIWILIGMCLFLYKNQRIVTIKMYGAIFYGALITNITLKPLLNQIRPCIIHPLNNLLEVCPDDSSFPSGHTTAAFASAIILRIYYKKVGNFALVLASLIAISRLYMFEHFPSDIFGGILVAIIAAYLSSKTVNYLFKNITFLNKIIKFH